MILPIECFHTSAMGEMTSVWQVLIGNLASVALLIAIWMHLHYKFYRLSKSLLKFGFGATMGLGIVLSMILSVEFEKGIYFDLRTSLLAISAIFGGPLAIAVTAPMALAFRAMMGGVGATNGLIGIVVISAVSLIVHLTLGKRAVGTRGIVASALVVPATTLVLLISLANPSPSNALYQMAFLMAFLNMFAAIIAGGVVIYFHRFTLERDILYAALTQAPDFHYVKNLDSEFVIANLNVAKFNGRQKSSEMVGLTDFDIASRERAQKLFDVEQEIMRSGQPIADFEEELADERGERRWFSTSKVALRNRHGDMVGVAGVTRDITQQKQLKRQLLESRDQLSQAMAEMSDGLAMFDSLGYLLFCNERYRSLFPLSAYARQPGAHITDILRAAAESGERKDFPADVCEAWLRDAAKELHVIRDTEIPLSDDRWLSLRTRITQDGSALVVISDISATKQSELSLRQLASQMKGLAETDALTGISNRRVFDEALTLECSRSAQHGAPLSLLMIDVDRFKTYNDHYGHPAGDECLKKVSECLRATIKRPVDVVARYGGEEFAVLLPGTDRIAALGLAERCRFALEQLGIPHAGSEHGVITVSVGVSTIAASGPVPSPAELLARADEALYLAKRKGRNRAEASGAEGWPEHPMEISA